MENSLVFLIDINIVDGGRIKLTVLEVGSERIKTVSIKLVKTATK